VLRLNIVSCYSVKRQKEEALIKRGYIKKDSILIKKEASHEDKVIVAVLDSHSFAEKIDGKNFDEVHSDVILSSHVLSSLKQKVMQKKGKIFVLNKLSFSAE
jgi:hypothetical protein